MASTTYLHLKPGDAPPDLPGERPFRALLVIEAPVTPEWRMLVSEWVVRSGCLYMMAWGLDCSSWDDSVDLAHLAAFDFEEAPDDLTPMTTWHADQPLAEAMWFADRSALHPTVPLPHLIIVHIAAEARGAELLQAYEDVRRSEVQDCGDIA
jgi:hypothetical protein